MTVVSFTIGKYKVNGTINDKNLVELVDTRYPNPVYGDMDYEMRYTKYKDFGGIKKAAKVEAKRDGEKFLTYEVTEFKVLDKVEPGTFDEPK